MSEPLVIYHAHCNDGFCAAWVARQVMPDAEFVAAQYGELPPNVTARRVFVLDFSYPREELLVMHGAAESLLVLDHHKTAEANLKGLPFCRFDMDKSGARLTEIYLTEPLGLFGSWLTEYTEDRDLWRWRLPHSREINAALASYPRDFAVWDALSQREPETLIPEGEAILRYQEGIVTSLAAKGREVEIGGYRVLAVNTSVLQSEIAGKLAEDCPFGAVWFQKEDGRFVYSLRSREGGIDVSEVAKGYGGGGHSQAAGFQIAALL